MTADLPVLAWYGLWSLVALSVVVLAALGIASAYPPAWAVVRRLWGGLSYVVVGAGVLVVAGVMMLIAGVRRRRREAVVMPQPQRDPIEPARQQAEFERAQAAQAAAESEVRTAAAVHDPDPVSGWAEMDAERDDLRRRREEIR